MENWLRSLKPGDTVIICPQGLVAAVARITPSAIFAGVKRFDRTTGMSRFLKRSWIVEPDECRLEEVAGW